MEILLHARRLSAESERRYYALAQTSPVGVAILEERRVVWANPMLGQILGCGSQDVAGSDFFQHVDPRDRDRVLSFYQDRVAGRPAPASYETHLVCCEGTRWVEIYPSVITYRQQPAVMKVVVDVSQRKLAEQQLRELNETLERRVAERTAVAEERAEQLRRLAEQLIQAEQKERERIATILHEHVQQLLVGAKYHLSSLWTNEAAGELLRRTDEVLDEAIAASRSLSVELSPPVLSHSGLLPALAWLKQWELGRYGLKVELLIEPGLVVPSRDIQVLLFHAVRELLFNVVKHAKVKEARVELRRQDDGWLRLTVVDHGIGFDVKESPAAIGHSGGVGLFAIQERLRFLAGRLEIQSQPGAGTSVALVLPLREPATAG